MGDYKELSIGKKDDEEDNLNILIEGEEDADTDNKQVLDEEVVSTDEDKNTADNEDEDGKKAAKTADEIKERKVSRSEKRIKQVLEERNQERAKRLEMEQELEKLRKSKDEDSFKSAQTTKAAMESQIESLNARLLKAIEDGDTGQTVSIQNEIIKTSNKLHDLTKEVENYKPYQPKKVETNQQPRVAQGAIDWLNKYSFVKEDPILYGAAVMLDNKLASEGWDRNSDEYYDEVTRLMSKRFPEEFGTSDENSVELETDTKKPSGDKTKNKSQRHVEQTVSGASRTPSTTSDGKPSNSKKNTITLTAEDIRLAKKWNMTPETYAKRKLALQNKERGEYVEININA